MKRRLSFLIEDALLVGSGRSPRVFETSVAWDSKNHIESITENDKVVTFAF